jgi:DNA polymerase-1
VNFGIAYGQGAFGLAETLNIPRGEASAIIKNYFQKFKNVKNYIEDTISFAHKNNYVETLFGRRRYLPELQSKSPMIKKFGERAAINAPIQGTASDIVKLAMIKLDQSVKSCMILQVHDELLFEEEENLLLAELLQIRTIMENVVNLKVPLKVNYSIGINWDEAH